MQEKIENKRLIDVTVKELIDAFDWRYQKISDPAITTKTSIPEFIDVEACALLTGYKEGYIRQLVFRREIPFYKVENRRPIRFKRTEILEWISGKKYKPIDELADDYINSKDFRAFKQNRR
jgi:excisionase family DNA binding protein